MQLKRGQEDVTILLVTLGFISKKFFIFILLKKINRLIRSFYIADPQSYLNASDDKTIEFSTRKFGINNYPADY